MDEQNKPPYGQGPPTVQYVAAGQQGPLQYGQGAPTVQYVAAGQQGPLQHGHGLPQQVVVTQPTPMIVQHVAQPSDGLCFSIFVCLCCCWPLGIYAIVRSVQCRSALDRGDLAEATQLSNSARTASYVALGLGIAIYVINVIVRVALLSQQ